MRLDIAPRPGLGVAVKNVERAHQKRLQRVTIEEMLQRLLVAQAKEEQRGQIGTVAPAIAVCLGQADIAACRDCGDRAPVGDRQIGMGAGLRPCKGALSPVRGGQRQAAVADSVEPLEKSGFNLAFEHSHSPVLASDMVRESCSGF